MSSTLYVDNLIEKTSGNGVIIPGHIVKYQSYSDGTLVNAGSSAWVTAFTYPTYTPLLTESTIVHRFSVLVRGYRSGSQDARGRIRVLRNGSNIISDMEMGNYDYGASGAWWRQTYSNGVIFNNVAKSNLDCSIQIAVAGATDLEYNSNDGGSTTRSFYEIIEVAP